MRIADFSLERYFAQWEFSVRHVLCASDAEPIPMNDLLALADDECRRRWESVSLGYTESLGLPALREEISGLYDGVSAGDVITFAGAEEGIFLAMHAILTPDDHVVVTWPAYQSLHEVARSIGASVTFIPLDPRDWSLDVDAVAAAIQPNTRLIVVNSPHSPTGAQLEPVQLDRLIAMAELHGAHLFCDEVYRYLEHGSQRLRAGVECSERAISLGVMSKAFGCAGLRIGWIATRDAEFRRRLASLKDYTTICNSAPSEVLALIALRSRERVLARTLEIIRRNLIILDDFFERNSGRFEWIRPRAGTVGFPRLLGRDVDEFAAALVEREGVLILPASRFGYPGNHFRLGFGRRDMSDGLAGLERFANTA